MIFDNVRNLDIRRYNIPAASEITVMFFGEDDDVPAIPLAIHDRRDSLQRVSDSDAPCDPLTYPRYLGRSKRDSERSRSTMAHNESSSSLTLFSDYKCICLICSQSPFYQAKKVTLCNAKVTEIPH
ncbi:hypothetical protein OESDEN_00244 [Oesophagostomum dentatum]|uniref:Uncharacterized protein n=1 Tax=Oesophagostomum dentatum TaxID=61180 RepID=A0A0B1TUE0_OESDE|nr:hypothetical protein OESDEN_00244 [Oesophagostomum dentatum]